MVDLVNAGLTPLDLLHVGFKESSESPAVSRREFSLVISNFLNGYWDQEFKADVLDDLLLIGQVAPGLKVGVLPDLDQIRRADAARHDLNTKVLWFLKSMDERDPLLKPRIHAFSLLDKFGALPFLTGSADLPTPRSGGAQVTVNTKDRGGKPFPNWRVMADPMGHRGDGTHTRPFGRLSTPTDRNLSIGDYWFWAEKDGVVSGGLRYSIVGDDILDLVVS
jgi:hypothetical protein